MRFLFLILFVSIAGCTPAMKLIGGFRTPKPEDKESITKYLNRKKIDTDNVLVFSDSVSYYNRIREVKQLPEIRVFNKEGVLVYHKDTAVSCPGPANDFTKMICIVSRLKQNINRNVKTETSSLRTLENLPVNILVNGEYDYYVFIYWALFMGRLNKSDVKVWESNLKSAKGCKVCVYKVDMDSQKRWYNK